MFNFLTALEHIINQGIECNLLVVDNKSQSVVFSKVKYNIRWIRSRSQTATVICIQSRNKIQAALEWNENQRYQNYYFWQLANLRRLVLRLTISKFLTT